jgi:multidrug resistance protein, MATE family
VLKAYHTYKGYFRKIAHLSYPIIIGQVGIVLMGVADVVMIGKVDATNLAAAAFANSIFFLVSILGIGTLTAVSPLVAKSKGGGHPGECAILFRQGINASLLLSVFISSVMLVLTFNLEWFGQDAEVMRLTESYLHILNSGIVFMLLFFAIKQFSDGLSITKPSAVITIIALLLNVFLNWVLIYGKFGMPQLGLDGAGIATTLSRLFMAVSMLSYVLWFSLYKPYLKKKEANRSNFFLKEIFRVGLPSGFQYAFEVGAFAAAAIIIGWYGKYELAAHQVAINIASVTYMIATGISAGGSIAVGDALGRKHKPDLLKSGRAALIMGTLFMGGCGLLFAVANHFIVGLYTNDAAVAGMAANLIWIAALFQLSDGIQCVSLGVLRGIADTKVPTIVTVVAYWVIGIPAGLWIAEYFDIGLYGIWFGLSLGLTFSAIMLTMRFLKESNQFNFVQDEKKHFAALMNQS